MSSTTRKELLDRCCQFLGTGQTEVPAHLLRQAKQTIVEIGLDTPEDSDDYRLIALCADTLLRGEQHHSEMQKRHLLETVKNGEISAIQNQLRTMGIPPGSSPTETLHQTRKVLRQSAIEEHRHSCSQSHTCHDAHS